jgi:hypothetical protein
MLLPPWFEQRRAEIMAMLEPIRIPEANGPVEVHHAGPGPSRRNSATFIGGDK